MSNANKEGGAGGQSSRRSNKSGESGAMDTKGGDDSDSDDAEGKLFMDSQPTSRKKIFQLCEQAFSKYLGDATKNITQSNDDIIDLFKTTDFKMRIHGMPLAEQRGLKKDDKIEEQEQIDDAASAFAVYVRVFSSDFVPFQGEDREQLSRMFGRTFAISSQTKLGVIH